MDTTKHTAAALEKAESNASGNVPRAEQYANLSNLTTRMAFEAIDQKTSKEAAEFVVQQLRLQDGLSGEDRAVIERYVENGLRNSVNSGLDMLLFIGRLSDAGLLSGSNGFARKLANCLIADHNGLNSLPKTMGMMEHDMLAKAARIAGDVLEDKALAWKYLRTAAAMAEALGERIYLPRGDASKYWNECEREDLWFTFPNNEMMAKTMLPKAHAYYSKAAEYFKQGNDSTAEASAERCALRALHCKLLDAEINGQASTPSAGLSATPASVWNAVVYGPTTITTNIRSELDKLLRAAKVAKEDYSEKGFLDAIIVRFDVLRAVVEAIKGSKAKSHALGLSPTTAGSNKLDSLTALLRSEKVKLLVQRTNASLDEMIESAFSITLMAMRLGNKLVDTKVSIAKPQVRRPSEYLRAK